MEKAFTKDILQNLYNAGGRFFCWGYEAESERIMKILNKGIDCSNRKKLLEDAKKNLVKISLKGSTIPHEIIGEFGAGRVLMKPAAPGTGVISGGPVRAVVEASGIKDIRAKALRSNNPCNVVRATIDGLSKLRNLEEVAEVRGKSAKEILG